MSKKSLPPLQILKTHKKYGRVSGSTLERVLVDPDLKDEKAIRNYLHQIWGAFWQGEPNYTKIFRNLQEDLTNGLSPQGALKPILLLHSSTKERLPHLGEFYEAIWQVIGSQPSQIIDYGCGLNPLCLPWMGLDLSTEYLAVDIDLTELEFIKQVAELLSWPNVKVVEGDLMLKQVALTDADTVNVTNKLARSKVSLLLKLLPTLEQQSKGLGRQILSSIESDYAVVSFPTKSLGSRKNLRPFYENWFESFVYKLPWDWQKLDLDFELVYVLSRKK